jgi:DNA-directed RNA polymerase specialized sigma24 family protein
MSPARKQEARRRELAVLLDELSKSCAPLAKYEGSTGGKSFEDFLQETFITFVEQEPDGLPGQAIDRKAYVLSVATRRYVAHKRRERDHERLLSQAARNAEAEPPMERLLVNDENRRIIMLAWIALEGKAFDRRLLYLLASGVDHKDNKLLARYMECAVSEVANGKKRLFPLLRMIRDELCNVANDEDAQ